MKRYRIVQLEFDSTPSILGMEINENWDARVKRGHEENKARAKESFIELFGSDGTEEKLKNYMELGDSPVSILAYHNKFFRQIRNSFVIGGYYPALTGVCALGERILNHLMLGLREDFKSTPEYKKVYKKKSFDNWHMVIDTLENWGIWLPGVADLYRKLAETRNRAIHFNPITDRNDQELALKATSQLSAIIKEQFSGFGPQPWFIPDTPGVTFLKKAVEGDPFIKLVYIPNCAYVGPNNRYVLKNEIMYLHDDDSYESKDISDEEFVRLYKKAR